MDPVKQIESRVTTPQTNCQTVCGGAETKIPGPGDRDRRRGYSLNRDCVNGRVNGLPELISSSLLSVFDDILPAVISAINRVVSLAVLNFTVNIDNAICYFRPQPIAGKASCLQGQDRSAVTHPSSSHARNVGIERKLHFEILFHLVVLCYVSKHSYRRVFWNLDVE
ncbi:hypothetical protein J6590_015297 [Homalodisca vitripennis]|nr:hypothetical protein J6590_015297 [Homalodisca vitripennis]